LKEPHQVAGSGEAEKEGGGWRSGWRNVWLLSGTVAWLLLWYFSWFRLVPLLLRQLGASDLAVSMGYGAMSVAFALMQLPAGILSDRWGRRPFVLWPTFAAVVMYLVASGAGHWGTLVAALVGLNVLSAIQMPAFMALLAESVPEARRGMAFAIFEFSVALAQAAGPALGGLVMDRWGMRGLMRATAGAALLAAVVRWVWLRETRAGPGAAPRLVLAGLGRRPLPMLLWVGLCFALIQNLTIFGPFVQLHATDVMGMHPRAINYMFAAATVAAAGLGLAGGKLTELWGAGKVLTWAVIGQVVLLLLWSRTSSSWAAVATFGATYAFFQLAMIAHNTWRTRIVDPATLGAVLGGLGTVTGVMGAAATPLGGFVRSRWGSDAPFLLASAIAGVMALSSWRLLSRSEAAWRRVMKREDHRPHAGRSPSDF